MKTMKKLCALMMALFLTVGICAPSAKAAGAPSAEGEYDGGYRIEDLLARFQYAVKGNVTMTTEGHTVGAVAVGGEFSLDNVFANSGIVPSYIYQVKSCGGLAPAWKGDESDPVLSDVVYYGEITGSKSDGRPGATWIQKADYMNLPGNFGAIETQSKGLVDGAEEVTLEDGAITIDLRDETADEVRYEISYGDFNSASNVFIYVDDINWFRTHVCVISVQGAHGSDEAPVQFDGYSKIQINGTQLGSAIEAMSGTIEGVQLNFKGMNLIWNFPDETYLNVQGLGGHLVAPKASVNLAGGNYEGGIIASEITGGAEGHFFPMSLPLSGSGDISTKTGSITLEGTKKVLGNAPSETYKFEVKAGTKVVATGTVTGAGKIVFTPITYKAPNDIGKHTYTITEVSGSNKNMKYDTTPRTVVVEVKDDGSSDDLVTRIVEDSSNKLEFENKLLGELVVNVFDEETGDKVPNAEVEVTYPDGTKHTHKTDSTGSFTIEDAEPGSYDIEVKEVPDGYTVTQGKTESAEVEAGKRTVHDVYINIASSNDPGNGSTPGGTTPGGTTGGTTGQTPGAGSAGQGGGTGTTVTGGTTNSTNTSNATNTANKTNTDSAVRTGDDSNLLLPIVLLAVSVLGIGIIVYRKKKSM